MDKFALRRRIAAAEKLADREAARLKVAKEALLKVKTYIDNVVIPAEEVNPPPPAPDPVPGGDGAPAPSNGVEAGQVAEAGLSA